MTDSKDAITEKQLKTIDELLSKGNRTDNQEEELVRLISKRDNNALNLGDTAITKLNEIFIKETYNREKDITNKYMEKGTVCEEDSIGVVDAVRKKFTMKNKVHFTNDILMGTPDIINDEDDEIEDLKSSWDIFSFFKADITKGYDWQLEGYCLLTGKSKKRLTYVLVNSPANLIDDEKRKMAFAIHDISAESELYQEKAKAIERNMIFDMVAFQKENPYYPLVYDLSDWTFDIAKEKRIKSFEVPRIPNAEDILKSKSILWRKYLNSLK
ncbi:MAG: hypothetical protein ACP5N7_06370 [Candidatus Pacearchaeota archaeon]